MFWWAWVLVGLALLGAEMATPGGLFALFFGIGALAVAPIAALGFPPLVQWVSFTVLSLGLLGGLRRFLLQRMRTSTAPPPAEIVGEAALLLEDVPAGGTGKAELRGVPWTARAHDGGELRAGQRARVERVD